jgi:hypothetical protein
MLLSWRPPWFFVRVSCWQVQKIEEVYQNDDRTMMSCLLLGKTSDNVAMQNSVTATEMRACQPMSSSGTSKLSRSSWGCRRQDLDDKSDDEIHKEMRANISMT